MPDANVNLTVDDVDFTAESFIIPVGDFAGLELLFNDPLLRLSSFITGFDINHDGFVLTPTLHINVLPVWEEYSGAGVSIGSVESFDDAHRDLTSTATNGDMTPTSHGTAVASIVVGEADNEFGSSGIAYAATIENTRLDNHEQFDVVHSSIGLGRGGYIVFSIDLLAEAIEAVSQGRNELGTIKVQAAGNDGALLDGTTETTVLTSSFEIIAIVQADAINNATSGSRFGSGIHVTGLTGNALSQDSIISADLAGDAGRVSADTAVSHFQLVVERGLDLSFFGLDTGDYRLLSGTSAAAPVVSGSVALVLEASGNNIFGGELGWRDVQELLAVSARHMGSDLAPGGDNPFVEFDGLTQLEHRPWTINGASTINGGGFHFSVDYGFGYVDVKGAVRLAETWGLTHHSHNLVTQTEAVVNSGQGLGFSYGNPLTFEITAPADALDLDVMELVPVFTHDAYREIQISVTSPSGTVSYLFDTPGLSNSDERIADWIDRYGEDAFGGTFEGRTILSRQFWGEDTTGTWTITIEDMVDNGNTGSLSGLDIVWKGDLASDDDTYYFTDDWALMNEANGGVPTIHDSVGDNSLNLAAVSDAISLNLNAGAASRIGGDTAFRLGANTAVALAITGDGDDVLVGTAAGETLVGMRGDDVLRGGDGNDLLSAGSGNDAIWAGAGDTGDDTLFGGTGDDVLAGGAGDDFIVGGDANGAGLMAMDLGEQAGFDTLYGGAGNDTLIAGSADEGVALTTGGARNTLYAGTGDDLVIGDGGGDILGGGAGADQLEGQGGHDTLYGGAGTGMDTLEGGTGNDQVFAGGGADFIEGGDGNDTLFGGGGNDTVDGGAGDDLIYGGAGNDALLGGEGEDTFAFITGFGTDTISDFGSTDDDTDVLDFTEIEGLVLADLLAAATFDTDGATLTIGTHGIIVLEGIDQTDLQTIFENGQVVV